MRTNRLIYNREQDRTTALNRPVITMLDIEEKDEGADTTTVLILGDRVLACGEDSLFIIGEVSVESDSLTATCDSAFYDLKNEWIRLRGEPVVTVTGYTAWGDEIDLYTPEDKLESAVIRGNARAEGSKDTEEEGEVTGQERYTSSADSLLLAFEEEKLKTLSAYSNAKSLVEREDAKRKVEKNYVIGDAIIVDMKEGKVGRVVVEGMGKGVYVIPPDSTGTGVEGAGE